jgi:membrane protein YqaA with SNARE-associated domain
MPAPLYLIFLFSLMNWVQRLGAFGLILLGVADNSVIPLPGSMDVFTVWLAASHRNRWFLYAALATAGAMIGGYITYALARKGGKEALENRFPKKKLEKIYDRFEKRGFWSVAIPALLPPPFPIVPFLLAAGALQFDRRKFLGALALGRGLRFALVAGMGALYGPAIVSFFSHYYKPALYILAGLSLIAGSIALYQYFQYRNRTKKAGRQQSPRAEVA